MGQRLTLSNGPPLGQSRYARHLEVFAGFCSQEAGGLPHPVQQSMEYELPLLVLRHLEFTSTLWFGDQLAVPALETMLPLAASAYSGVRGPLPSSQSGISVSRPGVFVTALRQESKSKTTFLRLWELAGESGKVTVRLPSGFAARIARPVDLRSNSLGQAIAVQGGLFELELNSFAPASFELE